MGIVDLAHIQPKYWMKVWASQFELTPIQLVNNSSARCIVYKDLSTPHLFISSGGGASHLWLQVTRRIRPCLCQTAWTCVSMCLCFCECLLLLCVWLISIGSRFTLCCYLATVSVCTHVVILRLGEQKGKRHKTREWEARGRGDSLQACVSWC